MLSRVLVVVALLVMLVSVLFAGVAMYGVNIVDGVGVRVGVGCGDVVGRGVVVG